VFPFGIGFVGLAFFIGNAPPPKSMASTSLLHTPTRLYVFPFFHKLSIAQTF